jgi:hypothetical protein
MEHRYFDSTELDLFHFFLVLTATCFFIRLKGEGFELKENIGFYFLWKREQDACLSLLDEVSWITVYSAETFKSRKQCNPQFYRCYWDKNNLCNVSWSTCFKYPLACSTEQQLDMSLLNFILLIQPCSCEKKKVYTVATHTQKVMSQWCIKWTWRHMKCLIMTCQ